MKLKELFFKIFGKKRARAVRNGKWKEFNKAAVLISEGHYINDIKHGHWKQYYESGELLIEENYDNGILHGQYLAYHSNGQLMSEGNYRHGKREGFFNVFDEEGAPLKRLLFMDNELLEETDPRKVTAAQVEA